MKRYSELEKELKEQPAIGKALREPWLIIQTRPLHKLVALNDPQTTIAEPVPMMDKAVFEVGDFVYVRIGGDPPIFFQEATALTEEGLREYQACCALHGVPCKINGISPRYGEA